MVKGLIIEPTAAAACSVDDFDCDGTATQCIPDYDVCDGVDDCDNGKDEQDCDEKDEDYYSMCKYLYMYYLLHDQEMIGLCMNAIAYD